MKSYQQFFAELKRRQVFKVAAVYGAVGFGVLELTDILVPLLELPDAFDRGIAVLIVLAFPIALVLAWALEVTPDGVRRTEPAPGAEVERIAAAPRRTRWPIGLAAVAGTALLAWGAWWTIADADGTGGSTTARTADGAVKPMPTVSLHWNRSPDRLFAAARPAARALRAGGTVAGTRPGGGGPALVRDDRPAVVVRRTVPGGGAAADRVNHGLVNSYRQFFA